jgi:AmiR/NasT family two-component response regulator
MPRPLPVTRLILLPGFTPGAPPLQADLEAAGFKIAGISTGDNLVRDALRWGPDVAVLWAPRPDAALWQALEALAANHPLPVLVFTDDMGAESLQRALAAGVSAWEVQAYAPTRLRALVQQSRARFEHEHALRQRLADLNQRFEERKLVDRAKGILMRAAQLSEEDAFRALRTASMHGQRRVGQVSQVIDAARDAHAINRAGQLRMLSQHAVKLYALLAAQPGAGAGEPAAAMLTQTLAQTRQRARSGVEELTALLSQPTFGDLLAALGAAWQALDAALAGSPQPALLAALDERAEHALIAADRLATALQAASAGAPAHVVNLCGRQRMLSQRVAKAALLAALAESSSGAAQVPPAAAEFEAALATLRALPLSTPEIRSALDAAAAAWQQMMAAMRGADSAAGQQALAGASEVLLEIFERQTERYERSLQWLMGGSGGEVPA